MFVKLLVNSCCIVVKVGRRSVYGVVIIFNVPQHTATFHAGEDRVSHVSLGSKTDVCYELS